MRQQLFEPLVRKKRMWLAYVVLFIALCPGVLFTAPALSKSLRGKVAIAAIHALIFVIVANLLDVAEGFRSGGLFGGASSGSSCRAPAGSYCSNGVLTACPSGTYSMLAGATACTPCPAGKIPNANKSGCTKCPNGQTSVAGATTCTPCAAGQSSNENGVCRNCEAGKSSIAGGACTRCPSGQTSVAGGLCVAAGSGSSTGLFSKVMTNISSALGFDSKDGSRSGSNTGSYIGSRR